MIASEPRFVARSVLRNRRRRGIHLSFRAMVAQAFDPRRIIDRQHQIVAADRSVHL